MYVLENYTSRIATNDLAVLIRTYLLQQNPNKNTQKSYGLAPDEGLAPDGVRGGAARKRRKAVARRPAAAPKWVSTGRKVTLHDGTKRSLYKNAGKPGELRIRRMGTRNGQPVATYVKPR